MARWPELRPEEFVKLPAWFQHKINRCLAQYGGDMPRGPSRDHFTFPPQVNDAVRAALKLKERRKGFIKKLYEVLQKEHPDWMPKHKDPHGYSDFYQLVKEAEQHLQWERERAPTAASPVASVPEAPPAEATAGAGALEQGDLMAMAKAAHALIDLAFARRDRDVLQLTLEALDHLFHPSKPTG